MQIIGYILIFFISSVFGYFFVPFILYKYSSIETIKRRINRLPYRVRKDIATSILPECITDLAKFNENLFKISAINQRMRWIIKHSPTEISDDIPSGLGCSCDSGKGCPCEDDHE